jgi:hypothetical protein
MESFKEHQENKKNSLVFTLKYRGKEKNHK